MNLATASREAKNVNSETEGLLMEAALLCGAVVAVVVIVCVAEWRTRRRFNERFPPISDAEFLARCKPGTNPEVALKVRRVIADALGIEYDRVHPDARLVADLDCC
jgi:hypothetical protein